MHADLKHTNSCCSEHILFVMKHKDGNGANICDYV